MKNMKSMKKKRNQDVYLRFVALLPVYTALGSLLTFLPVKQMWSAATRHSRNQTKISHEDTKSRRNQQGWALPETASMRHIFSTFNSSLKDLKS
jgi:hypothetical protein